MDAVIRILPCNSMTSIAICGPYFRGSRGLSLFPWARKSIPMARYPRRASGADLPTLQALLGHADLKATSIYLHLSERHLRAAGTPIDQAQFSSPDQVKRSKRLHKKQR